MDCRKCPNLVTMFFDQARRQGERPFLWAKEGDTWRAITWREARTRVAALARGLKSLGLVRGDRVGLVAENRPEWILADLAILAAGGVSVPAGNARRARNRICNRARRCQRASVSRQPGLGRCLRD